MSPARTHPTATHKMKVTILNTRLEVAVLGLPPLETVELTARALADCNAGLDHPNPSLNRWLRSLRGAAPLTMAGIRSALTPDHAPTPDPRRMLSPDVRRVTA